MLSLLFPKMEGKIYSNPSDYQQSYNDIPIKKTGSPDTDMRDTANVGDNEEVTTWKSAWYNFCQDTTVHGLKQITEPQPFCTRRLVHLLKWTIPVYYFSVWLFRKYFSI